MQYAAGNFRAALKAAGLVASMSRRGNCYDNAAMESFWSTLKLELVYRGNFTRCSHARSEIFDSSKSSITTSAVTHLSEAFHPLSSNSKTTNQ